MRDTRKLRKALVVGLTAAIGAIILEETIKPGLQRRLRVR